MSTAVRNMHARVYALAISAAMGSAMFGYNSAFIGGTITLSSFEAKATPLPALKANIVSTFQAGCFFGAILCYPICEKFGRRISLLICGLLFNIGAIIQLASPGNVGMIYAGRALTGLADGASSLIVPQYISECFPPAIRGRLIGIFEICLQCAQIIWLLVPGGLLILFMSLQPESPRWLFKVGRRDDAIKNLSAIRRLPAEDTYMEWEVATIEEQLQREHDLGADRSLGLKLKEAFSSGNRSRSVGFTGTNVGLLATGVFGIVKATATAVFMIWGIDRLGRRKSLLIGSAGDLAAMFYLGGYTSVSHSFSGKAPKDGGAYVAIVMIYLFSVFYAMSWNGIPWIFCAEVFPTGTRSICLVFTTCAQWLGQFIIVYSTPYMMTNITYGTFLFFGASLVVAMVIVYFLLPETKGLSLEEMDILFTAKGSAVQKRIAAEEFLASQREAANVIDTAKAGKTADHIEHTESLKCLLLKPG
ncbi:hypothetical protein BX600DRAFT_483872 [Xylariales sp. PMI_506]|nr:hypothetical protein BX600DRAFT_483872 [Xylariales sp. PMI_506]